ncbi:MAG: DUF2490 domain-containing protein [Crocinitomicaceae bacterium]|nr:DUF2490 domain-containing protein [Crocinitomicaceae bacterium]
MKKLFAFILVSFLSCFGSFSIAQINPPGLGESEIAGWFALGIRQNLDSLDKRQILFYSGFASMSTPQNRNPFHSPAMLIVNTEYYDQFHKNWQYSGALSYRVQYEYENDPPYENSNPGYRNEIRIYTRFSNVVRYDKLKMVNTIRTDFRTFYSPDFQFWNEDFQFRLRLRSQLSINLTKQKNVRFIFTAEPLFSISHFRSSSSWNHFRYRESRLCFFLSYKFNDAPLTLDIGYMNNILQDDMVHYISSDIILTNLFRKNLFRKNENGTIQM